MAAADADSLAYPISPEYVKSWTPVRAISELIANALDEDPNAAVSWTDGVLTIADDGPGIPEEGLILGMSSKTDEQIGQFGEGKKLACLVLARSPQIGPVRCETVSYGFVPTVERRKLLGGLIPSRTQQGSDVLVYHFHPNTRTRGTTFTIECPRDLAQEAIGRFRALAEPGYQPPAAPGVCVRDGDPGRVWIGGVLVTRMPGFLASYDLSLDHKALQNRDRTVVEASALRTAVRDILAGSDDPPLIALFARHVLDGGKLREQEQFFTDVNLPRPRAAWRTWGRANLPEQAFYQLHGAEEGHSTSRTTATPS
ncbi:ATP-binding protein [Micromonospora sp. NPDC050980]|uniref:ATP-binding protein n=1 Tax=Micromonospora sp. NPDC050980 TaxID=3155161 RepID=UPI0033E575D9